jgi:hypothetical protein
LAAASIGPAWWMRRIPRPRRSIGKCRKDQIMFSQGDPADAVFYIQESKVKVVVVSEQGKEAVVAILGPDDFFGEGCLAGQPRRMATVSAIANGLFMRLEKASVVRVIHDEPAFSEKCSSRIGWLGPFESKRTWSINCSIRARNASPGCCFCWRTLARKEDQSR